MQYPPHSPRERGEVRRRTQSFPPLAGGERGVACKSWFSSWQMKKQLLLINPWIDDFAAFDLWLKPLGLLYLAGHLRQRGYAVHLLDCLDRHNPALLQLQGLSAPRGRAYGVGKFFRQRLPIPAVLREIPRVYYRHGISEAIFVQMLKAAPQPAAILVTSMMTYWYPGVFRAIELAKQHFPGTPVMLGGVYATLCPHHAKTHSQADYILAEHDPAKIIRLIDEITGGIPSWEGLGVGNSPLEGGQGGVNLFTVYPAFDLYELLDYACLLTSVGCPYRCTYCAAQLLKPHFVQRRPDAVFQELLHDYKNLGIRHFAFYDDALLVHAADHLEPFLQQVIAAGLDCTFHTPNGLHARYLTEQVAELMFQSGFKTIRLSLETIDPVRQQQTGGKITGAECQQAVANLKRAGFQGKQIGVYLFVGLPGQTLAETEATIRYAHALGVTVHLCEYSPIPGTKDWETLVTQGFVSAADDPLLHNNSVFIFSKAGYTFAQIQRLKDLIHEFNNIVKAE